MEPRKYSIGNTVSPSTAVIEAIASINSVEPIDIVEPLYEVIDPDALDRVIQSSDKRETEVHFEYDGHQICVNGAGEFTVTNPDP